MNKDDFYLNHALGGFYSGRTLIQASGKIGGHRSVFVNIVGNGKNALTYPTFGGILVNPFKGRAKIYAGDVFEFDPGLEGNSGATVKILKYYEVAKTAGSDSAKTILLKRDGYRHIPFVGDNLMVGQKTFTTKAKGVTVTAVTEEEQDGKDVWKLTLSETLGTLTVGTVLVEASASGANVLPMVTNPNCFAPCDVDMPFFTQSGSDKYHAPRYFNDFCLLGTDVVMWKSRMSPIPPALEAMNTSRYAEWWYAEN